MQIDVLKNKIHKAVDASDDLQQLALVSKFFDQLNNPLNEEFFWEQTDDFQLQLQEALKQADDGKLIENEDAIQRLRNRSWPTK